MEGLQTVDGMRVQVPNSFFDIDPNTADITVNTSLEREAAVDGFHYYEITVSIRLVCGNCNKGEGCLLYTSPSPRDATLSRMPSSA